ncbi:MAG: class I SAM-dependent rRNA methyltransferase [Chromatiales bacterium]|jgi:23S rRNA (cytosine1962-C5)-methyltransferase
MSESFPALRLKRNEERRLRAGHLWVFSNEVDVASTPLTALEPGDPVEIQDHHGRAIGSGYANPRSLICARLLSRDHRYPFGPSLIVHRLKVALSLRERLYRQPYYRWVYGESDGLPGLVVDRYGELLVVQVTTAGMERQLEAILDALDKLLHPAAVLLRNDAGVRELEGLPLYVRPARGEVPTEIEVPEGGARFRVALAAGQKTGWFYDQADNRARLRDLARGGRVLDLFSYVGAWGVQAALAGAESVLCVDESGAAVEQIGVNAVLNGVEARLQAERAEAFAALRELREARERFDLVIVDPPAFIKRKKDLKEGVQAYRRLNQMAMQVLNRDGLLVSCSCSYHLPRESLVEQMNAAARHLDRGLQILYHGYQGPDHPIHPAIRETEYLKAVFARVVL